MEETLTKEQLEQQDFIDNAIEKMLLSVMPDRNHDIETIGTIRDALVPIMAEVLNVSEDTIYPGFDE